MKIWLSIVDILKKPFPLAENWLVYIWQVAWISLFVFLFLYIFQPFDISTIPNNKFLTCLGFGLANFIACIIYEFIIRLLGFKRKPKTYTFGKWILLIIGLIFTISLANFIFARFIFFGYIDWQFFPHMIRGTLSIGMFPIIAIGAITLLRQEKQYQNIAEELNQQAKTIPSVSNAISLYDIPADNILYVEALQNYVKIKFIDNNEIKEKVERATMKNITEELNGSPVIRCHRSFLVNRNKITSISGNAQGLLLSIEQIDETIPVSRSYIHHFKSMFKK